MTAETLLRWLADRERGLWVAAVLLYGVGDTATTFAGLSTAGVAEVGPVAAPLVASHGPTGLLAIKAVTFALFVGCWAALRAPARTAVPLAMALVGAAVTAWNLVVIVSTVE